MSRVQENKIQPLSAVFFSNLIKLETDFVNKNYTAETLDELVENYSQAVEYYDSIKDQIASYFIYKIQDTLAQKKSLKLLINEKAKITTPRGHTPKGGQVKDFFAAQRNNSSAPNSAASTEGGNSPAKPAKRISFMANIIAESMNEEKSDNEGSNGQASDVDDEDDGFDFDEEDGLSMAEKQMRSKNRATHRKSIATLKKKTQKLFTLQMKLQNEKASVKQTLNVLLATFTQTGANNDKIVAANVETQRRNYRQRLDAKLHHMKRKSFNLGNTEVHDGSGSTVFLGGNSPNMGHQLLECAAV